MLGKGIRRSAALAALVTCLSMMPAATLQAGEREAVAATRQSRLEERGFFDVAASLWHAVTGVLAKLGADTNGNG